MYVVGFIYDIMQGCRVNKTLSNNYYFVSLHKGICRSWGKPRLTFLPTSLTHFSSNVISATWSLYYSTVHELA